MEARAAPVQPTVGRRLAGIPRSLEMLDDPLDEVDKLEWMDLFMAFLNRHCLPQIENILQTSDSTVHYGVSVRHVFPFFLENIFLRYAKKNES